MKRNGYRYWFYISATIIFLFVMVAAMYIKRETLLQIVITKAQVMAKEKYNYDLTIASAKFSDFSMLELSDVTATKENHYLFHIKKINLPLKLVNWLFGYLTLDDLAIENGDLEFIDQHFKISFDSIYAHQQAIKNHDKQISINGHWTIANLSFSHPAISSNEIKIPSSSLKAHVTIDENCILMDDQAEINLNKITIHPYVKYMQSPAKGINAKINTNWLLAQDIFDAIPLGMCDALKGIEVSGRLKYALEFHLDQSTSDELIFDSRLDADHFEVMKYGTTDLSQLNGAFTYTPCEKDKCLTPRVIGSENPNFTLLKDISPYLTHAVIAAEDTLFYSHHGFDKEAIRQSLVSNLKENKFKRGASTITMQLVKNAFLNRQKNLSRKFEEIIITWLIESTHLITKDRILEVYLNIIEWGNNVYGISEASHYYFDKLPSELSLGESIFLASIIPRPKTALHYFLPTGALHPKLFGSFYMIQAEMANKGLAESSGFGSVRLKEALRPHIPSLTPLPKN
jgi:hypothetical protein